MSSGNQNRPWTKQPWVIPMAGLVLAFSVVMIFRHFRSKEVVINDEVYTGFSKGLAHEIGRMLNGQGTLVLVVYDRGYMSTPVMSRKFKTFEKALKQEGRFDVLARPEVKTDIDSVPGFSASLYVELLETYSQADAIVSFVGPPLLSAEQIDSLPGQRPRLVVADNLSYPVSRLANAGVLDLAILNRTVFPPGQSVPTTETGWYEYMYTVFHKADQADAIVDPVQVEDIHE